jgi:hypothetical protein
MMIELVLIYCLGEAPTPGAAPDAPSQHCVEKRDPLEAFVSPAACMMDAQQRAQEYLVSHPKWHLSGWRCEVNLPHQEKA